MACDVKEIHNEYLRDPEFAAIYLSDALEEGDPRIIRMAISDIAEAQKDSACDTPVQARPACKAIEEFLSDTNDSKLIFFPNIVSELGLKVKVEA